MAGCIFIRDAILIFILLWTCLEAMKHLGANSDSFKGTILPMTEALLNILMAILRAICL